MNTLQDRPKILDKVAALLRKAASTNHEAEQVAFHTKAAELMVKYQIQEAELRTTAEQSVDKERVTYTTLGNASQGVAYLFHRLAPMFGCATGANVFRDTYADGVKTLDVHVWGRQTDRDLLKKFVDALIPQMRADILRDRPRSRVSYSRGWAMAVSDRYREVFTKTWEESGSSALIPTATEATAQRDAACSHGRRVTYDNNSFQSGRSAGNNADINQNKLRS